MAGLMIWMAVIFFWSAMPDLTLTQLLYYFDKPHQYFIDLDQIRWEVVFSLDNPFFSIPQMTSFEFWLHKAGHVFVYTVLGLLSYRWTRRVVTALAICVAYALFDELHQAFTPGRSARFLDVLLDSASAYVAIRLLHWWRLLQSRT